MSATSDGLPTEVLRCIRRILRKTSEHSRQLSRESGLTIPQLLCLRAIAEHEESTVARVSATVQLSAATVSRILDRLERQGLVTRERSRQDRRKVTLGLTEKGQTRLAAVPVGLQDEFIRRFEELSTQRQGELLDALQQIVEMMEASEIDAAPLLEPGDVKPAE